MAWKCLYNTRTRKSFYCRSCGACRNTICRVNFFFYIDVFCETKEKHHFILIDFNMRICTCPVRTLVDWTHLQMCDRCFGKGIVSLYLISPSSHYFIWSVYCELFERRSGRVCFHLFCLMYKSILFVCKKSMSYFVEDKHVRVQQRNHVYRHVQSVRQGW